MEQIHTIQRRVTCTCDACGQQDVITIYPRLIIDEMPRLRPFVADGSLFTHTCSVCHTIYPTPYSMYYVDRRNRLMIIVAIDEKEYQEAVQLSFSQEIYAWMMKYINRKGMLRIVRTPFELSEKTAIAASHYDDRIMEILKYSLMKKLSKQTKDVNRLFYNAFNKKEEFAVLFNDGQIGHVDFEKRWYQETARVYAADLKTKESPAVIDMNWAKHYAEPVPIEETGEPVSVK